MTTKRNGIVEVAGSIQTCSTARKRMDAKSGRKKGIVARVKALSRVEKRHWIWLAKARTVAYSHFCRYGSVTIDDIRGKVPAPADPHAWGGVFNRGDWQIVGYAHSSHLSNHGRRIAVWTRKGCRP